MELLIFFFLMYRRPRGATLTATLFPSTTLFRSVPPGPLPSRRRQARSPERRPSRPLSSREQAPPLHRRPGLPPIRGSRAMARARQRATPERSEEHTSELQSLMRISYAVFCLKKKTLRTNTLPPTRRPTHII